MRVVRGCGSISGMSTEEQKRLDDLAQQIYWAVEGGRTREARQLILDEVRIAVNEAQIESTKLVTELEKQLEDRCENIRNLQSQ